MLRRPVSRRPTRGKLVLDAGCGVGGVTRALVARARAWSRSTSVRSSRPRRGPAAAAGRRRHADGARLRVGQLRCRAVERSHRAHARSAPFGGRAVPRWSSLAGTWCSRCRTGSGRRRCGRPRRSGCGRTTATRTFCGPQSCAMCSSAPAREIVEHRGMHLWPFQITPLAASHDGSTIRRSSAAADDQPVHSRREAR